MSNPDNPDSFPAAPVPDVPQVPHVPEVPQVPSIPGQVAVAPARQPTLSIISMVAGILAVIGLPVVFVPIIGGILGLFFPAAAIVLGVLGKTREPQAKGFWLTGIITGSAAAAAALISIVVWVLVFATLDNGNMYMNNGPF